MVYGTYNNSYWGESKPTKITFGGPTFFFGGPNTEHIFWWYQSIDSWLKQGHAGDTSSLSQGHEARPAELDHRRITWNPNGSVQWCWSEGKSKPETVVFPFKCGKVLRCRESIPQAPTNSRIRNWFVIPTNSPFLHPYLPAGLIQKRKFGEPDGDGSGLALILSTKSDHMTITCSS